MASDFTKPDRVHTLWKSEVKEKMEPSYLNQKSSYYNDYRNAAEELQLITVTDTFYL